MLKLILFLSICLSINAAQESKYTRLELRNLKYLKLEAIASKRYCKEANEKLVSAQAKEDSKIAFIKKSKISYKGLQKKYKCRSIRCKHGKNLKCYRARTTLRKALAAINKSEVTLIKLAKTTLKNKCTFDKMTALFAKNLKAYTALRKK